MELVTVDIGGTNARFALARIEGRQVAALGEPTTLATDDYPSLEAAWAAYRERAAAPLPRAAAIAIASPVRGSTIKLTNNSWVIQPATLAGRLGVDHHVLVNDFGAVGHAVAVAAPEHFTHLSGPDDPLPTHGNITVCGPGTGLGVAQLLRNDEGYRVIETEGGHINFAPLDSLEDAMVHRLRPSYTRVSAERIVSGPGLVTIYETLAMLERRPVLTRDDKELWSMALEDRDPLAVAALDRFFLSLGATAGDLALAHGASAVVIAGGLGLRLKDRLPGSGFSGRFTAKGRFGAMMAGIPVKLITHPQPGLLGAAAAFAQEFGE